MKVIHKNKDITALVTTLSWSGDYKQAARTISLGIAVSPHDHYLPSLTIRMGDLIVVLDDNEKEIFQGYVFLKNKSNQNNEMSITAYDGLIYMLKSKGVYNFKKVTPQAIARRLCSDFGIPAGSFISGTPVSRLFNNENIYNILMTAYTIESKRTGKQYMPKMINGKLNVIEKGKKIAKYELDGNSSISDSTYGESIENSINRVKIYDENNKRVGEVTLSGVPGVLQDIYIKEEGVNPTAGAKEMLQGISQTASIDALGDFDCVTGNAVRIKEPYTGLTGLFYIDSDTHTFESGQHTMRLGLSFSNIMDSQEGGSADEREPV